MKTEHIDKLYEPLTDDEKNELLRAIRHFSVPGPHPIMSSAANKLEAQLHLSVTGCRIYEGPPADRDNAASTDAVSAIQAYRNGTGTFIDCTIWGVHDQVIFHLKGAGTFHFDPGELLNAAKRAYAQCQPEHAEDDVSDARALRERTAWLRAMADDIERKAGLASTETGGAR